MLVRRSQHGQKELDESPHRESGRSGTRLDTVPIGYKAAASPTLDRPWSREYQLGSCSSQRNEAALSK